MRISDWSSDVCSSDLADRAAALPEFRARQGSGVRAGGLRGPLAARSPQPQPLPDRRGQIGRIVRLHPFDVDARDEGVDRQVSSLGFRLQRVPERSEEHTSELQSLMRISYAVFCLKKKTKTYN